MKIRELRKAKKESLKEIANLLGVAVPTYANYEYGNRPLPLKYAKILATHWNVSIDDLVGFSIPTDQKAA